MPGIKTIEDFSGLKAIFQIPFLSSGNEFYILQTSTAFFINLGLFRLAFKINEIEFLLVTFLHISAFFGREMFSGLLRNTRLVLA